MCRFRPALLRPLLALLLLTTLSRDLAAQMLPYVRYRGQVLPVVDATGRECWVIFNGSRERTDASTMELRKGDAFAEGSVVIQKVKADLEADRSLSAKERADSETVRTTYEAEVVADRDLKQCYGVLTFVASGAVGAQIVTVGNLHAGQARAVSVKMLNRIDAVGHLHVFSAAREVRSDQVPGPYDVTEYYATLSRTGGAGVSALLLARAAEHVPHALSADGTRLATIRERDTHYSLIAYDVANMKLLCDINLGGKGQKAWDLRWVSDHELAYVTDNADRPNMVEPWEHAHLLVPVTRSDLMVLDVEQGTTEKLMADVAHVLLQVPRHPERLLLAGNRVWQLAGETAFYDMKERRLAKEQGLFEGLTYFDDDGNDRIRYRPGSDEMICYFRRKPDAPWERLDASAKASGLVFDIHPDNQIDRNVQIHSFSSDGDLVYISTRANSDKFNLAAFSLSKAAIVQTVAAQPKYDLARGPEGYSRLLFRKASGDLLGVYYEGEKPHVAWLHPHYAAVQKGMDEAVPGHINEPIDWSADGKTFVFYSFNDQDPGTYYLLRTETSTLIPLFRLGEPLQGAKLGRDEPTNFTARDGAPIYGYVTYPPAFARGKPAPLVVYVHGGPMARDSWGYDPMVQFLATRGYVVLQVNYRGSSGYGTAYQKKGLYEPLDTVVLDDIADCTRALIDQGVADRGRVAIMGGSFGGWATYMSLIKYPELYRAGIAIAAVSHWKSAISDDRYSFGNEFGAEFWKWLLKRQDFAAIEARIDPLVRAADLHQPICIMHGELDSIVHIDESKDMIAALGKTNPHVESVFFPSASHTDWPFQERVKMMNYVDEFLKRYLAPPAGT